MVEIGKNPLNIIGLSIITSNDRAQNDISSLWSRFEYHSIKERLGSVLTNDIFSVYSDYENKHFGKYRVTIGYAVLDQPAPKDLTKIIISPNQYEIFQAKGNNPVDIIETWQKIWSQNEGKLARNYQADFEVYSEESVRIYIGVKDR